MTEQQLKAESVEYRAGTFPFSANARARALGDDIGMIIHAHPSLAEALEDAALGVDKRSLNI